MNTEWRYIDAFAQQFRRCGMHEGEVVAILSESQSREVLISTSRLCDSLRMATTSPSCIPHRRNCCAKASM